MKQFSLSLHKDETRPHVDIYNGLTALIDSGADIPLCRSAELLEKRFNAKKIDFPQNKSLRCGSGIMKGCLFELEVFEFGDLIYPHLHMFVPDKPEFEATFLISASMFYGLIYEIDYYRHRLTITIPDEKSNVLNARFEKDGVSYILANKIE